MSDWSRVYVAGHTGLVGSAIVRRLAREPVGTLLTRTRAELDLTDRIAVEQFFSRERPTAVFLAAARVGGIHANMTHPADFIRDNLLIQTNVIDAASKFGTKKLLFLGSSCIYPKFAPQPLKPEYLLTGELEPTNRAYAVAKIAGVEMCKAYRAQFGFDAICVMPTNLYGPEDNFDSTTSHVIPALIGKIVHAKRTGAEDVSVWGTGNSLRDFLYVDDLADALIMLMKAYSHENPVNVGSGEEVSIRELAMTIAELVGFRGQLKFNTDMPDGTPRKILDCDVIFTLGWQPAIGLRQGLARTIEVYTLNASE